MRFADLGRAVGVLALILSMGARGGPIVASPMVALDALETRVEDGRIVLDGTPFTGFGVTMHNGEQMAERTEFVDGRKHGTSERWYIDGTHAFKASYRNGSRDGRVRSWWPDGTLRSEANFENGVADGVQREWYRSGALFKELTLVGGRESGLQRAWRENGALYANYVAQDGRIFGLKRADLCLEVAGGAYDGDQPPIATPSALTTGADA